MNTLKTLIFIFSLATYAASTCDFSSAFCSSSGITCPSSGKVVSAGGNNYNLGDIDVISFNDVSLNNGDIQNRVAVRNNFYASNGASVGDQLTDGCGFSLIVGGDLIWADDGAVYPLTSTFFVGGSFTGPSYFNNQISTCSSTGQTSGCLGTYFDGLYNYWSQFSSSLSVQTDNVQVSYNNGIATLTCGSSDASTYYVHISSSDFNQIIGYNTSGCSAIANWVFNLNGAVTFGGNPISVRGFVIYNIGGTLDVTISTSVAGSIVAPNSNVNMVGGTVYGQMIAGNFSNIVQVNTPNTCPTGAVAYRSSFCSGNGNSGSSSSSSDSGATGASTIDASSGDASSGNGNSNTTVPASNAGNSGSVVNGQSPADSGVASLAASFLLAAIGFALV